MSENAEQLDVYISATQGTMGLAVNLAQDVENWGHRVLGLGSHGNCPVPAIAQDAIWDADAVIVLLEEPQPTTYFEAGIALGIGRPILLVGGTASDPPALMHMRHILTGTVPGWWRAQTRAFLESVATSAVGEWLEDTEPPSLRNIELLLHWPGLLALMPHDAVADVVAVLLRQRGAEVVREGGAPGIDAQLDVVAHWPSGRLTAVECKSSRARMVSMDTVQRMEQIVQMIGPHADGLLVTTGDFTEAARHWSTDSEALALWDGERLREELTKTLRAMDQNDQG